MAETDSKTRIADRLREIPPSGIRRYFDISATMKDVISLGIGEPDFTTPRHILEVGIQAQSVDIHGDEQHKTDGQQPQNGIEQPSPRCLPEGGLNDDGHAASLLAPRTVVVGGLDK